MTIVERIDNFKRLWDMIIVKFSCPPDSQAWLWVSQHNDAELEHALNRLRSKVRHGTLQGDPARYVTAVLNAERRVKAGAA